MTDTDKICRVMAEAMYYADCHKIKSLFQKGGLPENIQSAEIKELLEILIRNYTIVPEMVELCHYAAKIKEYGQLTHLIARAEAILAKEGRK